MKKVFLLLLPLIFITGCDSGTLWKDGKYSVDWIDTSENKSLYYELGNGGGIGRVEPEVIAVGANDLYVVVKQKDINSKLINYFYIEKSKDRDSFNQNQITQGPFNEKEFDDLSKKFNFPKFTKEF